MRAFNSRAVGAQRASLSSFYTHREIAPRRQSDRSLSPGHAFTLLSLWQIAMDQPMDE
jgi:hypothetical protein